MKMVGRSGLISAGAAAGGDTEVLRQLKALQRQLEAQSSAIEELQKKVDDVLWFERVADVAEVAVGHEIRRGAVTADDVISMLRQD